MTSNEFEALFKMITQVVELQGALTKQVGSVVDTVSDLTEHCVSHCEGKCGVSHGV